MFFHNNVEGRFVAMMKSDARTEKSEFSDAWVILESVGFQRSFAGAAGRSFLRCEFMSREANKRSRLQQCHAELKTSNGLMPYRPWFILLVPFYGIHFELYKARCDNPPALVGGPELYRKWKIWMHGACSKSFGK